MNKDNEIKKLKNELIDKENIKYEEIELAKKRLLESEISSGEMSEIVRINENLKIQLNMEILQLNNDLQVKQSKIEELLNLIKSRQIKFRQSVNNNPTDFWT
jgi:hypothetical protein